MAPMKRTYHVQGEGSALKKLRSYKPKTLAKKITRIMDRRLETKCYGAHISETEHNNKTLYVYDVSDVATGSETNNRDGEQILPTRIDIKGLLHNQQTAQGAVARILLLKTKGIDSTITADYPMFLSVNQVPVTYNQIGTNNVDFLFYPINHKKFQVLADRRYNMSADAQSAYPPHQVFSITKKLHGKMIFERGQSGPGNQNHRYLLVFLQHRADSDESNDGSSIETTFHSRLFFKDI